MKNLILITLLLSFTFTCFSQEGKWQKTQSKNTITSYQKFIDKYPDSEYAEEAQLKIIELEYEDAKKSNTIESYNSFIKKYSDNEFALKAQKDLMELEYVNAKNKNTMQTYKNFINKYPNSEYVKEVNIEVDYIKAVEDNSIEALKEFKSKNPNSAHSSELNTFLNAVEQNTAIDFENYINTYPNSPFYESALLTLVELKYKEDKYGYTFKRYIRKYNGTAYEQEINKKVEELEYQKALTSKSTYEMQSFINKYPNSKYVKSMQDSIIVFEYKKAIGSNSVYTLKNFIDKYPDTKYSDEINDKLFEVYYNDIQKNKTYSGYLDFIERFPNSKYEEQLKSELYDLHLKHVKKENKVKEYQEFLNKYPDSGDKEEIESLLACKENTKEAYKEFQTKYPDSKFNDKIDYNIIQLNPSVVKYEAYIKKYPKSEYSKSAKQEVNNLIFSDKLPTVLNLIASSNYSDPNVIKSINDLCKYPPTKISYKEFRDFQRAMGKFQNIKTDDESSIDMTFFYSFVELAYHISNAVGRSSMNIMLETATSGSMVTIDIFKVTEAAQSFIDYLLVFLLNDNDVERRHRGLVALDRITLNNSKYISEKWTNGEQVIGLEVMMLGIPINLISINNSLDKIYKLETNANNKKLIMKIKSRTKI